MSTERVEMSQSCGSLHLREIEWPQSPLTFRILSKRNAGVCCCNLQRLLSVLAANARWAVCSWLISFSLLHGQDVTEANSPSLSYAFAESPITEGQPILTSIVSYVFPQTTSEEADVQAAFGAQVSYVFPVWPGDANVKSSVSLPVAYYHATSSGEATIAFYGRVTDIAGNPIAGATVSAGLGKITSARVVTASDGKYELPPILPAVYALRANKEGFSGGLRLVELDSFSARQNFQMELLPKPPPNENVNDPVPPEQRPKPRITSDTQLKVLTGSGWETSGKIDDTKMTLVLTHGWVVNSDSHGGIFGWPTSMGGLLKSKGILEQANILAWDWYDEANTRREDGPPVDHTTAQGLALGKALYASLGQDYAKPIHFLGHSLGTLVNAHAANFVHKDGATERTSAPKAWKPERTHMTLFDEAEVATVNGQRARAGARFGYNIAGFATKSIPVQIASGALGLTVAASKDWRNPLPSQKAWADNYITLFGINHPDAVNICLQAIFDLPFGESKEEISEAIEKIHGYPMDWYEGTIQRPWFSLMGFTNTFELRGEINMPPTGDDYMYGRLFLQAGDLADRYRLRRANDEIDLFQCQQEVAKRLGAFTADVVADGSQAFAKKVGDAAVAVGEVIVDTAKVGYEVVRDTTKTVYEVTVQPGLSLILRTTRRILPFKNNAKPHSPDSDTGNQEAYAWIKLKIPPDAAFMEFDFTLGGESEDDTIACGLNGTNVFSLEAKFVTPDSRTTSSMVNVSNLSGRETDLFFGLLGGTSTNCTVTIDAIRFLVLAKPTLEVQQLTDGTIVLRWPSAAEGYGLESATNPTATDWSPLPQPPSLAGGRFAMTNSVVGDARFFRLRRQ